MLSLSVMLIRISFIKIWGPHLLGIKEKKRNDLTEKNNRDSLRSLLKHPFITLPGATIVGKEI